MKFEAKQVVQLENIMQRLADILEKAALNDPMMVGLAKAYGLMALAYAHADFRKVEI